MLPRLTLKTNTMDILIKIWDLWAHISNKTFPIFSPLNIHKSKAKGGKSGGKMIKNRIFFTLYVYKSNSKYEYNQLEMVKSNLN